jgi:hypothetical protein
LIKDSLIVNNKLESLVYINIICRKGEMKMKANKSIGCTVNECQYHAKQESYCSLDHINVVKHTGHATNQEATDCGSFKMGK